MSETPDIKIQRKEQRKILNLVNVHSNVVGKGEIRTIFLGESCSFSKDDYLHYNSVHYSQGIPDDYELLDTTNTDKNLARIFYNKSNNLFYLYVYQNILNYKSETIDLKLLSIIELDIFPKVRKITTVDQIKCTIFLAGESFVIINFLNLRISIVHFNSTKPELITIFLNNDPEWKNLSTILQNVINVYSEEGRNKDGEIETFSYVFLKEDKKRRDQTNDYNITNKMYSRCTFFILTEHSFRNFDFSVVSMNMDPIEGNDYLMVDIARIFSKEKPVKWFYIFLLMTSSKLYTYISDYGTKHIFEMMDSRIDLREGSVRNFIQIGSAEDFTRQKDKNTNMKTLKSEYREEGSVFYFHQFRFDPERKNEKPLACRFRLIVHKKFNCALIIYNKNKTVVINFSYDETPSEIHEKFLLMKTEKGILHNSDFFKSIEDIRKDKLRRKKTMMEEEEEQVLKKLCYCELKKKFGDNFIKARVGLFGRYFVSFVGTNVYIEDTSGKYAIKETDFFGENLNSVMVITDMGTGFLISRDKIIKVLYIPRYKDLFLIPEKVKEQERLDYYIKNYKNRKFPQFEFSPLFSIDYYLKKIDALSQPVKTDKPNKKKFPCEICSKLATIYCGGCKKKFYCSLEHLKYDYDHIHFAECFFYQFLMKLKGKSLDQVREKLYEAAFKFINDYIKMIFFNIFGPLDYFNYFAAIYYLIEVLNNFGFLKNVEEYCFANSQDMFENANKIYLESTFIYYQLNILKCVFCVKSGKYNIADSFIKIIGNELCPKLSNKTKKETNKITLNKVSGPDSRDNLLQFLRNYVYALSLPLKLKIKLESDTNVKEIFRDIALIFDKNLQLIDKSGLLINVCLNSLSYFLVETGNISNGILLLQKATKNAIFIPSNKLRFIIFYNLGLLQYAIGEFKKGIHQIEISYDYIKGEGPARFEMRVMETLGLAYLNIQSLGKAFILFSQAIGERSKIQGKENEIQKLKLNAYISYTLELYEYIYIAKMVRKKRKNSRELETILTDYVTGKLKRATHNEENAEEILQIGKFIYGLPEKTLTQLNSDQQKVKVSSKGEVKNNDKHQQKEQQQFDTSSNPSSMIMKDEKDERGGDIYEWDEDIEIKMSFFDSLERAQQNKFNKINSVFLTRENVLRDVLGPITQVNINFHPVYSEDFLSEVVKLRAYAPLKKIFFGQKREIHREEVFDCDENCYLYGLSKYLRLDKIENMINVEKAKIIAHYEKFEKEPYAIGSPFVFRSFMGSGSSANIQEAMALEKITIKSFRNRFLEKWNQVVERVEDNDIKLLLSHIDLEEGDTLELIYYKAYKDNPDGGLLFKNPFIVLNYIYNGPNDKLYQKFSNFKRASEIINVIPELMEYGSQKSNESEDKGIIKEKTKEEESNSYESDEIKSQTTRKKAYDDDLLDEIPHEFVKRKLKPVIGIKHFSTRVNADSWNTKFDYISARMMGYIPCDDGPKFSYRPAQFNVFPREWEAGTTTISSPVATKKEPPKIKEKDDQWLNKFISKKENKKPKPEKLRSKASTSMPKRKVKKSPVKSPIKTDYDFFLKKRNPPPRPKKSPSPDYNRLRANRSMEKVRRKPREDGNDYLVTNLDELKKERMLRERNKLPAANLNYWKTSKGKNNRMNTSMDTNNETNDSNITINITSNTGATTARTPRKVKKIDLLKEKDKNNPGLVDGREKYQINNRREYYLVSKDFEEPSKKNRNRSMEQDRNKKRRNKFIDDPFFKL